MTAADPGATPTATRALAPDLARGAMLLLIALANAHVYLYGHLTGPRGYPLDVRGVDQAVVFLQMTLVDGRAYPLFGLLFGYGVVQLAARQRAGGPSSVTALIRRRGAGMIVIGVAHGMLLWAGDIVGAYGVLAVLMAGLLVRGSDRALLATAACGVVLVTLATAASGLQVADDPSTVLRSMTEPNWLVATRARAVEWISAGFLASVFGVFGAVALGAWAARRRWLDDPERHRTLLLRVAVAGLTAAVLGGMPLALMSAQIWTSPPLGASLLAGSLHGLGGYLGAAGYAAAFGLWAIRVTRREQPGPVAGAVRACGQRSLSCYLAQSVAFAALLPAWTLGLGELARVWQVALVGLGTWVVIVLVAAASDRVGYRGPAEVVLRRLTYGRPDTASSPAR